MKTAKLNPQTKDSFPRLKLSVAVLAIELAKLISSDIDIRIDATTDSKYSIISTKSQGAFLSTSAVSYGHGNLLV